MWQRFGVCLGTRRNFVKVRERSWFSLKLLLCCHGYNNNYTMVVTVKRNQRCQSVWSGSSSGLPCYWSGRRLRQTLRQSLGTLGDVNYSTTTATSWAPFVFYPYFFTCSQIMSIKVCESAVSSSCLQCIMDIQTTITGSLWDWRKL